jgi:hypothetical protein
MPRVGGLSPLPHAAGGGPSRAERAYGILRRAVGVGGSAPDDRGIEGLWRRAKAKGLAAATSATRRALLQAFPYLATDLLPYYERVLGISPPADTSEAQRRAVVVPLWTRQPIKSWRELEEALQKIDSRFSLLNEPFSEAATTQRGRAFGPLEPGLETPIYGLPYGHTKVPMYSSQEIIRVRFTPGYSGALTASDQVLLERARVVLRESVQSWEDFQISTGPWVLGTTPIGQGECG